MSYLRRKRRIHVAQEHEFYEAPSGQAQAMSGEMDLDYGAAFPGPRERRFVDAQNVQMRFINPVMSVRDNVDWAVGGIPGMTKFVGSEGVTDPQTVDAHDFRGEMAIIRRLPDTNYGPVGTADHNSLLSLLYAMQESSHYFPNETSQRDVIKAV